MAERPTDPDRRFRPGRLLAGLAVLALGVLGLAAELDVVSRWLTVALTTAGAVLALASGLLSAAVRDSRPRPSTR